MKLSGLELEVLQYICDAENATAPAVHAKIIQKRETSYSTIKTMFDRLENKGAIYRKDQIGRTCIYAATITPESVQATLLRDFVKKVFPKDNIPLFNTLIRDSSISPEEIRYLEQLINQKKK